MVKANSVMGVMKMGNIIPRVGIKPTSLAFSASVLQLHHVGSLMSPVYPCSPDYASPCLKGRCRLLHMNFIFHFKWLKGTVGR